MGRFERTGLGEVPLELPRGRSALPPDVVQESQRRRLLHAMTELAGSKGIAEVTVADLVEKAGVSRRSFYAVFADKTDCYLTAYTLHANTLLEQFSRAMRSEPDPAEGLLTAFRVYLGTLAERPLHARAYLLESVRAGSEVLAHRWRTLLDFVGVTHAQVDRIAEAYPELESVSENTVVALIGGVNELACRELDRIDGDGDVAGLEEDIVELTLTLLGLDRFSNEEYVL